MANLRMMRSIGSGPTEGVTLVVRNSFTAPTGSQRRAIACIAPPTIKPMDRTTA